MEQGVEPSKVNFFEVFEVLAFTWYTTGTRGT